MRYKVGDRVKVVANNSRHGFQLGTEVVVVAVNHEDCDYRMSDGNHMWFLWEDEVEPINPTTPAPITSPLVEKRTEKVERTVVDEVTYTTITLTEEDAKALKEVLRLADIWFSSIPPAARSVVVTLYARL